MPIKHIECNYFEQERERERKKEREGKKGIITSQQLGQ
jgi:hypothetical protein